jgi:hypothetical protein
MPAKNTSGDACSRGSRRSACYFSFPLRRDDKAAQTRDGYKQGWEAVFVTTYFDCIQTRKQLRGQ